MATDEEPKVRLRSSDGEFFDVDAAVAKKSETIAAWLDEEKAPADFIPVPNVKGSVLAKVIEYCVHHVGEKKEEFGFRSNWDVESVDPFDEHLIDVDQNTIFDLIQAANYLNIKGLLDLGCRTVANMMKEKSVEELRDTFNIKNDYSAEEEAELRAESAWAFENI